MHSRRLRSGGRLGDKQSDGLVPADQVSCGVGYDLQQCIDRTSAVNRHGSGGQLLKQQPIDHRLPLLDARHRGLGQSDSLGEVALLSGTGGRSDAKRAADKASKQAPVETSVTPTAPDGGSQNSPENPGSTDKEQA